MNNPLLRLGRTGGAAAVGLFLLSCLLALPALWWTFNRRTSRSGSREYSFSTHARATPKHNALDASTRASELKIKSWHYVADMDIELAQFETVFWELKDTDSLRSWIAQSPQVRKAHVLEVGTGTGLVAICCALHGAAQVVATDINPNAHANAIYNVEHLGLAALVDVRLVPQETPSPFSTVGADERFDLIISNPPWEDAPISEVAAYALYDPGFALLDGLITESKRFLQPQGKLLLAYGAKRAIARIVEAAPRQGWEVQIHDDRNLEELPEVFLPAMLIELGL